MDYSKIQGLKKTNHPMASVGWGSGHSLDATSGLLKAIVRGRLGLLSSHGSMGTGSASSLPHMAAGSFSPS